jgi:hypothetical protein
MSFIVSNKFQKDDTKDQLEVLDLLNEARGKMGLFSSIEIRQLEREIDNDQKKKIKQGQLEIESENEDEDEDEVYGEDNKSGLGND